jgi:hypothetical protein
MELTSLVTSARAAYEIAKGLKASMDQAKLANEVSDLLERLLAVQADALALQSEHQSLIAEKSEIAKKLMQLDNWSNTEKQYTLHEPGPGIFVYASQVDNPSPKKQPWLCPRCFEDHIRSILQRRWDDDTSAARYDCPRCNAEFSWEYPGHVHPTPEEPEW